MRLCTRPNSTYVTSAACQSIVADHSPAHRDGPNDEISPRSPPVIPSHDASRDRACAMNGGRAWVVLGIGIIVLEFCLRSPRLRKLPAMVDDAKRETDWGLRAVRARSHDSSEHKWRVRRRAEGRGDGEDVR
jgi:hypothetical protein